LTIDGNPLCLPQERWRFYTYPAVHDNLERAAPTVGCDVAHEEV
jgi:hypothetical protein